MTHRISWTFCALVGLASAAMAEPFASTRTKAAPPTVRWEAKVTFAGAAKANPQNLQTLLKKAGHACKVKCTNRGRTIVITGTGSSSTPETIVRNLKSLGYGRGANVETTINTYPVRTLQFDYQIINVDGNKLSKAGLNFPKLLAANNPKSIRVDKNAGVAGVISQSKAKAFFAWLQTAGFANVVSAPRVMTLEGQPATIKLSACKSRPMGLSLSTEGHCIEPKIIQTALLAKFVTKTRNTEEEEEISCTLRTPEGATSIQVVKLPNGNYTVIAATPRCVSVTAKPCAATCAAPPAATVRAYACPAAPGVAYAPGEWTRLATKAAPQACCPHCPAVATCPSGTCPVKSAAFRLGCCPGFRVSVATKKCTCEKGSKCCKGEGKCNNKDCCNGKTCCCAKKPGVATLNVARCPVLNKRAGTAYYTFNANQWRPAPWMASPNVIFKEVAIPHVPPFAFAKPSPTPAMSWVPRNAPVSKTQHAVLAIKHLHAAGLTDIAKSVQQRIEMYQEKALRQHIERRKMEIRKIEQQLKLLHEKRKAEKSVYSTPILPNPVADRLLTPAPPSDYTSLRAAVATSEACTAGAVCGKTAKKPRGRFEIELRLAPNPANPFFPATLRKRIDYNFEVEEHRLQLPRK